MKKYPYLSPNTVAPAVAIALMFGASSAVAQSASGGLSGTITDPTGAIVPGVTVCQQP